MFRFLEDQPLVTLFLVLSLGYLLGRARIRGVRLGNAASILLVGLAVSILGQRASVTLAFPASTGALFFDLFIFAVGLKVGPQVFAAIERDGKRYVVLALVVALCSLLLAYVSGRLLDLPPGATAGLLTGSNTTAPGFGAAESAIASGALRPDSGVSIEELKANLSAAFAIAYVVGMVGYLLLTKYLPGWFGVEPARAAGELVEELKSAQPLPLPGTSEALVRTHAPLEVRSFRIRPDSELVGLSVAEIHRRLPRARLNALRRDGAIVDLDPATVLRPGDVVAVSTLVARLIDAPAVVGPEVNDPELRAAEIETVEIVLSKPDLDGKSLAELAAGPGRGLYANALFRMGESQPVHPGTKLQRNDVLRVTGPRNAVRELADGAGTVVRVDVSTDIFTLAAGLLAGGLVGAIAIPIGGIRLALGAAGGLILSGIALGILRARNPALGGPFPEPARKLLEDLGLSFFIAVLAINSGAGVAAAVNDGTALALLLGASIVALLPPVLAWLIGLYGLGMNPAVLLGALAGAHQNSAAMQVAKADAKSEVPALGFPVPYVLSTLLFTVFGYVLAGA